MRWGFVPRHTADLKVVRRTVNARSDMAPSSPVFRSAMASRRCLIPADAFYEWQARPDGKQSYATARQDGQPIALAGLWESWRDPAGGILRTFAILTAGRECHNGRAARPMRAILEPADWPVWLEAAGAGGDPLDLLRPAGRTRRDAAGTVIT